ncbi:MAG: tyrosine-type recombinase/integrase [Clostridiales bacterium]|nr:tyrosine-type recombinase/integrase [Clostridiales bacterium]
MKTARPLPVYLDREEGDALLDAAMGSRYPERDCAIMRVFLQTGCRLNELVQLEISQVNLDDGYVRFVGKEYLLNQQLHRSAGVC